MKISELDNGNPSLSMADFENFFDVTEDRNGYQRYNLNSNLYFNFRYSDLMQYVPTHDMHWPIVSHAIYGTTRFAWLLCKLNDVDDPIYPVTAGTPVAYIPQETVNSVVQYLSN